jgi:osmotically-inducible protein OsmY
MNMPASLRKQPMSDTTAEKRDASQPDAFSAQRLEDVRLAERVQHALCTTGYAILRGLDVTVHDGIVILRGRVPSYHMKQVAQESARAITGIRQLRNQVEVFG